MYLWLPLFGFNRVCREHKETYLSFISIYVWMWGGGGGGGDSGNTIVCQQHSIFEEALGILVQGFLSGCNGQLPNSSNSQQS